VGEDGSGSIGQAGNRLFGTVTTGSENEVLTRVEGDVPMGRLMRAHSWIPFSESDHLSPGDGPVPVRLFGQHYVAFRTADGRVGFLDELCPHRRASLLLARVEGDGVRCIYHGWKILVSGRVVECPTQTVRAEQFAARVPAGGYPVEEVGGLAWVWLGAGQAPPFPHLPFADPDLYRFWCTCRVPCNWLQGLEGSVDSVHAGVLHQTWIAEAAKLAGHSNLGFTLDQPPTYETEATPYGLRAAALRKTLGGETYVRVTEHLLPLVTVVPVGGDRPRSGTAFVICPVDDTHHVLFFGNYGDSPDRAEPLDQCAMQDPAFVPDPYDYTGIRGGRSDAWGQDRALMSAGHFTGFGRSLLEEDAVIQTSMGPIVDRSKEHLSSSDVAVAHLRRMLLEAIADADGGRTPVGSANGAERVLLPNASEMLLAEGGRWQGV
jgi:nitrite reductase/ring-hydroxylating ferredoxin subunit